MGNGRKTSILRKLPSEYIKETIFELIIVTIVIAFIYFSGTPISNIIDGSLIAIILALPISVYKWVSGKKEKFFNDNIERLIKISEEEMSSEVQREELIPLKLMQINYIYENRIKSKNIDKLEEAIISTVSSLVLNRIDFFSNPEDARKRIYSRLNFDFKDEYEEQEKKVNISKALPMIADLFVASDKNPLRKSTSKVDIEIYIGCTASLSNLVKGDNKLGKKYVFIADSTLNIDKIEKMDDLAFVDLFDSKIEVSDNLNEQDFKTVENLSTTIRNFESCNNSISPKIIKGIAESLQAESAVIVANMIKEPGLNIDDRKNFREKILNDDPGNFIKFSRSYSSNSKSWAGWFSLSQKDYKGVIKEKNHFYFVINPNPDAPANSGSIVLCLDKENFKKLIDEKESDTYATVKDKSGNLIYQFYLGYNDGDGYARDSRFMGSKTVKIKLN